MKNQSFLLLIYSILIFFIIGCSQDNSVKVIDTNFEGEVNIDRNLHFVFNKALVGDSILNFWDSIQYIKFEPEIKGRFKWSSDRNLVFSAANYMQPATSYKALLTSKITERAGLNLSGQTEFTFTTQQLKLTDISTFWYASDNQQTRIHIDLSFNSKINISNVFKKLSFKVNGTTQVPELINTTDESIIKIFLPNLDAEDLTYKIDVEVEAGIKPLNGDINTKEKITRNLILNSPYSVSVQDVIAEHNGVEGTLSIDISQEADEVAKKFISVSPNVDYDIKHTETGLKITSEDFDLRKKYSITIKKGLKGKYGGALKSDYKKEISFGKLRPEIQFVNKKAEYLSGNGNKNIEVKIINVENVDITVTKLYENNILSFMSNKRYNYDYDAYTYNFHSLYQKGDVIFEQKIITKDLPKKGNSRVLTLDIEDKIKDYNGIYVIKVSSNEKYWLKDSKIISISDIGLIAKEGKNSITVFVNSIKTTEPISGAEIAFMSKNNQKTGSVTTDADGVAVFNKPANMPSGFVTAMITAQKGSDYNFMNFNSSSVNTSKFDIGGKRENLSGFDVFLYGDRDIYRPGETVYLSGIVRNNKWKSPGNVPVIVKVRTPNGQELKTIKKTLNNEGAFETSLQLSSAARTGNYSVQVNTTNNVFLTSKNIKVEEFIPDRIKLEVTLSKDKININELVEINAKATNFFGPPAANRNYEFSISSKRKYFNSKKYNDYRFSIVGTQTYFRTIFNEGKTNENGEAAYLFQLSAEYKNMGLVQTDVYTTVFDETGRPVNRKNSIQVSTQDVYFGIASDQYYAATNSEIKFPLIALDVNKKVLKGAKARLKLIKHEYKTVLSRSGGYFRYNSEKVEKVIEDKEITIGGTNEFYSYVPGLSGRYELRISAPNVGTYVSRDFYAYGWGGTSNSSFEVNSEGQIDIQLDKDKYEVGETANVILKAPFSGKVLVTVEGDEVIQHFYVQTDKRATSFPLEITDAFVPNVYITATLFKPHEQSDLPLTVAHGMMPILIENSSNKLSLDITAKQKSRSKISQKIKIKSEPNTSVTLAVVDEGILQLTQFATPNPYNFFYRKKALGVSSYDIYPFLFPEIEIINGRIGGGDAMRSELAKRVNPLTNKRVKLVSFWSGILQTDGSGNAEFDIDIPQFSGDLRIMAVAYKDNKFTSTSENMTVADPIVISTALPRFFSPGDTVQVPITISNTTEKSTSCNTKLKVNGAVTILGSNSENTSIEANSESQVLYTVVAKKEIGQANITVDINALNENFKNSTDITIRPASPLQKISGSGVIKGGGNQNISLVDDKFIKSSIQRKLVVSNSPMVEFTKDLDYLIHYPHGCVEQTVSAAFPQLYFQDLTREILNYKGENPNPNYNITEAIKKLQLMQLYNGGLTYWPEQGSESWWGSVYALHFLHEAGQVGFAIEDKMLDKLQDYLITKLKTRETFFYYFNNNQKRKIANKEIPYSLYVLALTGKPQRSTMNYYKTNNESLSLDGKYLLAAAYKLIGDDKKYKEVLPTSFSGEKSKRVFGDSFYSYIRDEALALNVLLEVDPDNPQIAIMAKHLSQALKGRRYLNTQERVFSFLALGKIAKQNAGNNTTATIKSDGKTVGSFDKKTITLSSEELSNKSISIESKGNGNLYYFWETEGISSDGSYREEDSFLQVRKTFYDRNGKKITSNKFKQNDLIVVKLSLNSLNGARVENVAMTDILPAGFEIENPRISEVPGTEWIKNAAKSTYSDIRDDRITFFIDATKNSRTYYYVVRAVSKGTFQMGPVGADAMYDGEYHSYSGGGTIVIE